MFSFILTSEYVIMDPIPLERSSESVVLALYLACNNCGSKGSMFRTFECATKPTRKIKVTRKWLTTTYNTRQAT